ncbi:hypothetical protein MSG37_11870 [Shewanella sp. 1CM18E]|uniref:hypothetical protein n=1 Tax=Shewanella sp. 1CM18E TaxID=2929169 RepID=UPI0020BE62C8|nr:hypothetical protein [Shewanella sp. 1CM18E]MCK8045580.1 hypothetical protein [Shewanella sp. 1CM18E]
MESNRASVKESDVDPELAALVSELNRKRIKLFVFVIGILAGLPAGFYGARWVYQLMFPQG